MKRCLKCGQTYSDATLNFCLNDGELLVRQDGYGSAPTQFADDSPPTILMNQPRVTNPIDWPQSPLANRDPAALGGADTMFGMSAYGASRNQTLATASLVLGIAAVPLVCCLGGVLLGLPAVIVGYIAMRNADNEPAKYAGRGMAIAGMVLGIITFLGSLLFLIFSSLS